MKKLMVLASAVAILAAGAATAAPRDDTFDAAFERLKGLVGTWQIGDRDDQVRYYMTGDGSALVEIFETSRGMASVYHMDGDDLLVTHYCGANNQPRMKAVDYDPERGALKFDFVDVTNVADPEAYYTREIEIVFQDENHVEVRFNGLEAGEAFPVAQSLSRKRVER